MGRNISPFLEAQGLHVLSSWAAQTCAMRTKWLFKGWCRRRFVVRVVSYMCFQIMICCGMRRCANTSRPTAFYLKTCKYSAGVPQAMMEHFAQKTEGHAFESLALGLLCSLFGTMRIQGTM